MPELPEVFTVVSDLNKKIVGRTIVRAWCDAPQLLRSGTLPALARETLRGVVERVERRGKYILILFRVRGEARALLVHLKMTGHFLFGRWTIGKKGIVAQGKHKALHDRVNSYIHFLICFADGAMLGLSDVRKFARIRWGSLASVKNLPEITGLGPDPLEDDLSLRMFGERISPETRAIKKVLLDQSVLAGLGNIYADEILWHARIHPLRRASSLAEEELRALYRSLYVILKKSIRLRGASMSDYRDTWGKPGRYTHTRLVYRREGESCFACRSPIVRLKIAGRSSHFCPSCQPLPR